MSTQDPHDVVRLVVARNPVEAHIWEQALRENGIQARVVGDYLDASFGDLPGTKPEVWVHRDDVARATEVLQSKRDALPAEQGEPTEA